MKNSAERELGSLAAVRDGSGPASWGEGSWHQSDVKKYPTTIAEFNELESLINQYCLEGHAPAAPLLNKSGSVIAIGSCFAAELRHFLNDVGLSSDSFWIPSGLNNTFALLDFFSWAVTGEQTGKGYGYNKTSNGDIVDWQPSFEQQQYKDALAHASSFVFTLGLAEVWEDKESGKVFWRGVPERIFNEGRHHFRLSSVQENTENLENIVALIRQINPNAPIVFTVSPVPLKATFGSKSCITSDCVSKSTLRLAINDYMSKTDCSSNVYYWPSFEIVKWVGCHLPYPVYGTDDGCVRHVSRFLVTQILKAFVSSYYGTETAENVFKEYLSTLETRDGNLGEPPKIYLGQIVKA